MSQIAEIDAAELRRPTLTSEPWRTIGTLSPPTTTNPELGGLVAGYWEGARTETSKSPTLSAVGKDPKVPARADVDKDDSTEDEGIETDCSRPTAHILVEGST